MNDDSPPPSSDPNKKLQATLNAIQQQINEQNKSMLTKHARDLRALANVELDITKSVIQSHQSQTIEQLSKSIDHLRRRLRLFSWIPILSILVLCLSILAGAVGWATWTVHQADVAVSEKHLTIQQLEQRFCVSPAGRAYCQKGR